MRRRVVTEQDETTAERAFDSPVTRHVFTLEEANRLVPAIARRMEEVLRDIARARETNELLQDLETYHGGAPTEGSPERGRHDALRRELDTLTAEVDALTKEIFELGAMVKSFDLGLVDFYHMRSGRLVLLCWQVGEREIRSWHTIEAGFPGRQPL